jgi:hypothetical protein
MAGVTIYTTDYDPRQVSPADGTATRAGTKAVERARIEQVVRFGDEPLALLVAFDDPGGRVVWSFKGKRGSPTNRTEYFIADFATAEPGLFRAFAGELRALPSDSWHVPSTGELRWDLGFELWRLPPTPDGLDADACERLCTRLRERSESPSSTQPIVLGMTGYRSALAVLRVIQGADIQCRVGVGTGGDPSGIDGLDLLLVPGADAEFTPHSASAEEVVDRPPADAADTGTLSSPERDAEFNGTPDRQNLVKPAIILGTAALVYLAGYQTLLRGNARARLIMQGSLAGIVVGVLVVGSLRLQRSQPRLGGGLLGAIGVLGLGAGLVAMAHTVGRIAAGEFAIITAGIYMTVLVVVSAYVAYDYW